MEKSEFIFFINTERITMEIQEISLPVFYLNRILGVAPYTIKRNAKGQLDLIRRSSWWCIYSAIFLTAAGDTY